MRLRKRKAPEDGFERAFFTLVQAVGVEIHRFMGQEATPVPEEHIDQAVREIIRSAQADGDGDEVDENDPESFAMAKQEALAQAYEEVWVKVIAPWVTKPHKGAEMLAFMEARAGRPLEIGETA